MCGKFGSQDFLIALAAFVGRFDIPHGQLHCQQELSIFDRSNCSAFYKKSVYSSVLRYTYQLFRSGKVRLQLRGCMLWPHTCTRSKNTHKHGHKEKSKI